LKDNDFLEHFGIPGMHWGHRKARSDKASKKNKKVTKENYSEDYKKKKNLKKKRISEMTNDELRALNDRMQLEKQYKELNKQDVSAGQKFVTKVLTDIGSDVVKSLIKSAITGDLKNNQYTKGFDNAKIAVNVAKKSSKQRPIGFGKW
jgi:hypothetical protein